MTKQLFLITTAWCMVLCGAAQTQYTLQQCIYTALQRSLQLKSDNYNQGYAFNYAQSLTFIEPPESAIPNCLNIEGLLVPLQNSTLRQLAYNVKTNWRMYPGAYLQRYHIVFFINGGVI
jgi:hypothetical protein